MVWSSVVLILGLAAAGNGWAAISFGGMSAFGFTAAAALRRSRPRIAIVSALIAWLPLAADTWQRVAFAIQYPNFERPDGIGSPSAFVVDFVMEQIFFLPLTVMILLIAWRLWRSRRAETVILSGASRDTTDSAKALPL
jgi:hypothetical protein